MSVTSSLPLLRDQTQDALQEALAMLYKIPKPIGSSTITVDIENSHQLQGVVLGSAYLLKRLHDKYSSQSNGASASINTAFSSNDILSSGRLKKSKNGIRRISSNNCTAIFKAWIATCFQNFVLVFTSSSNLTYLVLSGAQSRGDLTFPFRTAIHPQVVYFN